MLATSQLAEWLIAVAGYQEVGTLPEIRRVMGEARGPISLPMALVGLALLPGIAEELALRGFVQRGLQPFRGPVEAVLITSVVFGLLHGDPVHAAAATLLGLYLGAVVALCGSIRPAMLCHVVNNAMATLTTAFGTPWIGVAALALGAVLGPWALWRTVLHARAAPPLLGVPPEGPSTGPPS
jgi:membrane protease YdiL (CAAX protease family)